MARKRWIHTPPELQKKSFISRCILISFVRGHISMQAIHLAYFKPKEEGDNIT